MNTIILLAIEESLLSYSLLLKEIVEYRYRQHIAIGFHSLAYNYLVFRH